MASNSIPGDLKQLAKNPLFGGIADEVAAGGITNPVSSVTSGLDKLVTPLSSSNFWLRIAEGLLGITLIAVAIGKLTGLDDKVMDVAGLAAKVK